MTTDWGTGYNTDWPGGVDLADPGLDRVLGGSPGARKAGGVYYTPPAVVDYLVRRALAPLLVDQTPADLGSLTILDPACGSGLFLLGAYRYLLQWYAGHQSRPLTPHQRAQILQAHIYGVDLDPQAVALARLALARTAADGGEVPDRRPDLAANLRCGNALVGADYAPDGPDDAARVRPFDWAAAFPAIMGAGGFDVVLGNPPYLSFSGRQAVAPAPAVRRYLLAHYTPGRWPSAHACFVERAVRDLARRVTALVLPDQVGHLAGYAAVRALVTRHSRLAEVRYWGEAVFPDAITPVLTFVADTRHQGETAVYRRDGARRAFCGTGGRAWHGADGDDLPAKLLAQGESLGPLVADPGVHTGNCGRALIMPSAAAPAGAAPVLAGRQVGRYRCAPPDQVLRLDYRPGPGEYFTIRPAARYAAAPFVIRQTAGYPIVGPRRHADYFRNSLLALYPPDDGRDVLYLVALLNSTLLRFAYRRLVPEAQQRAFPQVKVHTLRRLPIRRLTPADPADRAAHDHLVRLASRMLALCEHEGGEAQQIAALDQEIDQAVYALYGLTAAEIEIVKRET